MVNTSKTLRCLFYSLFILIFLASCKNKTEYKLILDPVKAEYKVEETFKYRIDPDVKKFEILWGTSDGDNEIGKSSGEYKYDEPGDYIIKLLIEGKLAQELKVKVIPMQATINASDTSKINISASATDVFVGDKVIFTDNTVGANDPNNPKSTTKWQFSDVMGVTKGKSVPHSFNAPGSQTATVSYDQGGPTTMTRKILINVKLKPILPPKPPVPGPNPRPTIPIVKKLKDAELQRLLQQMFDAGEKDSDKYGQIIHNVCDNESTSVVVNGAGKTLSGYITSGTTKRFKILSLKQIINPKTQCVDQIIINQ